MSEVLRKSGMSFSGWAKIEDWDVFIFLFPVRTRKREENGVVVGTLRKMPEFF